MRNGGRRAARRSMRAVRYSRSCRRRKAAEARQDRGLRSGAGAALGLRLPPTSSPASCAWPPSSSPSSCARGPRASLLRFFAFFGRLMVRLPCGSIERRRYQVATSPNRSASAAGTGPPVAQSISSTVWTTGMRGAGRDLRDAADIAGGDHVGLEPFDIGDLAVAQPLRQLRLQNVVGAGRAAAQMAFRHIFHHEAAASTSSSFGLAHHLLAVLQRAGGVIGDGQPAAPRRPAASSVGEIFGDVLAPAPRPRRPCRHRPDRCAA